MRLRNKDGSDIYQFAKFPTSVRFHVRVRLLGCSGHARMHLSHVIMADVRVCPSSYHVGGEARTLTEVSALVGTCNWRSAKWHPANSFLRCDPALRIKFQGDQPRTKSEEVVRLVILKPPLRLDCMKRAALRMVERLYINWFCLYVLY